MRRILISLLLFPASLLPADDIRIAAASNFAAPLTDLVTQFESQSDHRISLSFGSTGMHYAQISHGAPFDLFFAADAARPDRLEADGRAIPKTRMTYAIGRLILWSPDSDVVDADGAVLASDTFRHLAMANDQLAPYGKAARQVLEGRGLWTALEGRLVRGENIGQTFHFVKSGSAKLGFIAASQVMQAGQLTDGSAWTPPATLYDPIEQQVILLKDKPAARDFLSYVQSEEALKIIQSYGYYLP